MEIRDASPADADSLLAIYRPVVEQTAFSFELVAPSIEEFEQRIVTCSQSHVWLVAEGEGDALGYAYATPHRAREAYRHSVETSIYVDVKARGKGLGKQLYNELFQRLTHTDYHQAFAGVALPNDSSVALHQSVGFKPIGVFAEVGFKFGQWHDVSWWQRHIRE